MDTSSPATTSIASEPTATVPSTSGDRFEAPGERRARSPFSQVAAIVVWVAIVVGLLGYLCFGSITARMWKLDQFQNAWVEDHSPRRIAHIWKYQFDHLPQFTGSTMMQLLFGGSILVVLVGTAACLWLMLAEVRGAGSRSE